MTHKTLTLATIGMTICMAAAGRATRAQEADVLERISAACPHKPYAQPATPRTLLLFTGTRGYRHGSIPVGTVAIKALGEKSGAFAVVHTEDVAVFEPKSLARFDAVCMLNTTGELFTPPDRDKMPEVKRVEATKREVRLKKSLLDFVARGGGLVGIHAAVDCFYEWPEYGELIGGYFNGHPWHEDVVIKLDDPGHPLNGAFEGRPLEIKDEIYQLRAPYSRGRQRVLMSLDTTRTDMTKKGIHRDAGDFAVSWIRTHGKGRVFYCSLGHRDEIYWNPKVMHHYLAGIQYALGDLRADATPSAAPSDGGWVSLFNGRDLSGRKGLVDDPKKRAAMSPAGLAEAQADADKLMRAHWSIEGGVLAFDGHGSHLCTEKDYGDFEMLVDWKISPGGDSGIYLRGAPQVQIWDPAEWPEGSGGLYNNQKHPSKPVARADNPVGEWNTFRIKMIGDRVTVHLNGVLVVHNVVMENYWERDKPIYPRGQIELQSHGSKLYFRNIRIREVR